MNIENYKMSEEEIKKALECCSDQDKNLCRVCPLSKLQGECVEIKSKNALDLINRQKAEIERLKKPNENI